MSDVSEEVLTIKEKGNLSLKEGNFEEAVLHYTHAIKLDNLNSLLYSNRSYAFLKMQQFYFALQDAKETIKLRPDWAKGYFRKAEVEFQTFNFNDALLSYKIALTLQPNDKKLEEALEKTKIEMKRDQRADDQIPWVGAGVGIIIGVTLVIADHIFTHKPTIVHPITMAILTIIIAMTGYGVAHAFRYYIKSQRNSLLDPPIDLLNDTSSSNEKTEQEERETRPRYSKAQARQRFKKGRS